jgi:hypothetical protein
MDINYHTTVRVLVKPVWFNRKPTIDIGIDDNVQTVTLDKDQWFEFTIDQPASNCQLSIRHFGKTSDDHNIETGQDTAVIVESIIINGIWSPRFIWQGLYYTDHQESPLNYSNYLGWNGTWKLNFSIPAFVWIHKLENLGWIYD